MNQIIQKRSQAQSFIIALLLVVMPLLTLVAFRGASAASLSNTYVRPYRLKAGSTAKFRLVFKTVSAGATGFVVDFDGADGAGKWSASSGSVHAGSMTSDVSTCATETSTTGVPGSLTITGASSHSVTVTGVTALSATTTYCIDFTNSDSVTMPTSNGGDGSDGIYHPTVTETGGATDGVTVAVRSVAEDSIVVTASVAPSFNFAFNNTTTDAFGTLSTGGGSTTGKNITLTTNASTGWIVWAKSANGTTKGSLQSATANNYKITTSSSLGAASHTLGTSTEDYGLAVTLNTQGTGVTSGGGASATTIDTAYLGTSNKVGTLDSQNFRPIASSNGTTDGDIINVLERAAIKGSTPAANDYTDTISFIGAGNF